jgi:hypothetical protein
MLSSCGYHGVLVWRSRAVDLTASGDERPDEDSGSCGDCNEDPMRVVAGLHWAHLSP